MPALDIVGKPKGFKLSYDKVVYYKFKLPGFVCGVSNIYYCFYSDFPLNEIYKSERRPDEKLNKLFDIAKNSALNKIAVEDGVKTISVPMSANQIYASQLEWYYAPSKEIIAPMRLLNSKGTLDSEYTIGMIDEKVK